ncbi:MAG: arylesterase [Gammaproteobacteria bacterium]|nr:arylesterase [Gammaproteobacteria bacterium]MDE2252414.1 arylesterase [Gammaproteobacteria bacterium]
MSRVIAILLCLSLALPSAAARAAPVGKPVILVYGDSLSAGYGIPVEQGWVNLLSLRLRQSGYGLQIVNASVSGETTTGGLARLPRALAAHDPRYVIIELGANDGLRGLPLATTRSNLDAMIALVAKQGRHVLLLGMRMPPNYGERYAGGYADIFAQLARHHHVALVPFLLAGVADRPALMQRDGLHPNEHGQPILLDNVWAKLRPLLHEHSH